MLCTAALDLIWAEDVQYVFFNGLSELKNDVILLINSGWKKNSLEE